MSSVFYVYGSFFFLSFIHFVHFLFSPLPNSSFPFTFFTSLLCSLSSISLLFTYFTFLYTPSLSFTHPYLPFLSVFLLFFFLSSSEEQSVLYLMVPKPVDSLNQLREKGRGLKQKVLHAGCEWYELEIKTVVWLH